MYSLPRWLIHHINSQGNPPGNESAIKKLTDSNIQNETNSQAIDVLTIKVIYPSSLSLVYISTTQKSIYPKTFNETHPISAQILPKNLINFIKFCDNLILDKTYPA